MNDKQTWEDIASTYDKYPSESGLERWEVEALKRFDADARSKKPVLSEHDVATFFAGALPENASPVERVVLEGMALALWGSEHVDAAKKQRARRREDATPFGSFAEVLRVAVYGEAEMGRGSIAPETIDPQIPQYAVPIPNMSRVGYDFMPAKQTRAGSTGGCRMLGAVERRIDAKRGLARSFLGPTEVWMLVAVYIGEVRRWSDKQGGGLGRMVTLTAPEVAAAYRKRICTCDGHHHEVARNKTKKKRAKAAEATDPHAATCPAHGVSDNAIKERIKRARERLITSLVGSGIIPEPRRRQEEAKRKTSDAKAAQHKPAPISPRFASEGT